MTTKQIKIDSRVKHTDYGTGHVKEIHTKTGQCQVDFIRGPMRICPISSLKLFSTTKRVSHNL